MAKVPIDFFSLNEKCKLQKINVIVNEQFTNFKSTKNYQFKISGGNVREGT